MLTDQHCADFTADGFTLAAGMAASKDLRAVRNLLWRHLDGRGIAKDNRDTWPRGLVSKLQPVAKHDVVQALPDGPIVAGVDRLLQGQKAVPITDHPVQFLVTFPDAQSWAVPSSMWHLDIPRLPAGPSGRAACPGVQPFIFIDDVPAGAGGTVIVAGSHHLLNDSDTRIASAAVKIALADRYDWFASLMSNAASTPREHFMARGGKAATVPVRVVELTGKAGDVVFMDMRVLHAPAPNAAGHPRLMATARYVRQDLLAEIYGG